MKHLTKVLAACATALAVTQTAVQATTLDTSAGAVEITRVADGFDAPWAIGFLPGGGFLVTERPGQLQHVAADGTRRVVSGVPEVDATGQGGLLDVLVPRDFAESRQIYLTFAIRQPDGNATALGAGRLSGDGARLEDFELLFQGAPGWDGGRHFGSRIAEGPDGHIFITTGERGDRPSAQDLSNHNGSVLRLTRDGGVPPDNPFVDTSDAQPEIWSYGHRNPQGLAFGPDGRLWQNEHGAQGGDEVNLIRKGRNYGWPVISYGRHYSGAKIGEGTQKPGMEQPEHYWDPSIAPSGMAVYTGDMWPEWRGDLFVGSLKFDYIARLDPSAGYTEEQLKAPETGRVRAIEQAPDGSIWFLSVNDGALFRMAPPGR